MEELDALNALETGWARLGVEIDTTLYPTRSEIHLYRIVVAKEFRKQGLGTKAMEDLTRLADRFGFMITLSPSTDFGGTSVARLKEFYRRFGFVSNKGRNKIWQISSSMYRKPKGA